MECCLLIVVVVVVVVVGVIVIPREDKTSGGRSSPKQIKSNQIESNRYSSFLQKKTRRNKPFDGVKAESDKRRCPVKYRSILVGVNKLVVVLDRVSVTRENNELVLRLSVVELVNGQLFPLISALLGGVNGKVLFNVIF